MVTATSTIFLPYVDDTTDFIQPTRTIVTLSTTTTSHLVKETSYEVGSKAAFYPHFSTTTELTRVHLIDYAEKTLHTTMERIFTSTRLSIASSTRERVIEITTAPVAVVVEYTTVK